MAPIDRTQDWEVVRPFARAVAEALVRDEPERYVATMAKAQRVGKIFVDCLRNGRGATAIASWSVRARPGAAVAVPVAWEEVAGLRRGDGFDVSAARARLAETDPWADFGRLRQGVRRAALRELGVID